MGYIMIAINFFQSEATGFIHQCRSGEQIHELLRLTRPFELEEKTERRVAIRRVQDAKNCA